MKHEHLTTCYTSEESYENGINSPKQKGDSSNVHKWFKRCTCKTICCYYYYYYYYYYY